MNWTFGLTILSIIGVVANIHHKRWCFAVWMFTNAAWAVVDFAYGIYSQSLLQMVYFGLAVWGYWKWRQP